MFITDDIEGDLKFGTAPIREAFWGMMSTAVIDDLEQSVGFISQAQYPRVIGVFKPTLIDLEAYVIQEAA